MPKKPKQDPTVEVRALDYFAAQERWTEFWHQQGVQIPSFSNFLGMSNDALRFKEGSSFNFSVWVRASAAKKIQTLNSEHHHTILKAYQCQKK